MRVPEVTLPVKEPRPIISGWIRERLLDVGAGNVVPPVEGGELSEIAGQLSLKRGGFVEGVEDTSFWMRRPTHTRLRCG